MRARYLPLLLSAAVTTSLSAQTPDSSGFTVFHGADTVAKEHFVRRRGQLEGWLILAPGTNGGDRTWYRASLLPDGTAPLVEVNVWRANDPERAPAREQVRLIFKGDSVAVDHVSSRGMQTLVVPAARGAIPYVNLSFAWLEQALRRARRVRGDSVAIPFFSLGGGQAVTGMVRRLAADSMALRLGTVEFRFAVDSAGRIVGGGIPAQDVRVVRRER
jgi:hypothetical protein